MKMHTLKIRSLIVICFMISETFCTCSVRNLHEQFTFLHFNFKLLFLICLGLNQNAENRKFHSFKQQGRNSF